MSVTKKAMYFLALNLGKIYRLINQINSDGPFNFAVSILFSRFDNVFLKDFSDCTSNTGKFL